MGGQSVETTTLEEAPIALNHRGDGDNKSGAGTSEHDAIEEPTPPPPLKRHRESRAQRETFEDAPIAVNQSPQDPLRGGRGLSCTEQTAPFPRCSSSTSSKKDSSASAQNQGELAPCSSSSSVMGPADEASVLRLESAPASPMDRFIKRFEELHPGYDPSQEQRPIVCLFGDSDISHWRREDSMDRRLQEKLTAEVFSVKPTTAGSNACSVVNVGVGGAEMLHVAFYADKCMAKYQPDVLVLCAGENDIGAGAAPASAFSYFQKAYASTRAHKATLPILYMGTKPEPATESLHADYLRYDGMIQEATAGDTNFVFVSSWDLKASGGWYAGDQLHLGLKGYKVWNKRVTEAVAKLDL